MARDGELSTEGGLAALARLGSIDVSKTGVSGAKNFFEAKVKVNIDKKKIYKLNYNIDYIYVFSFKYSLLV